MYAIIQTGGRQFRIAPGDVISVEGQARTAGDELTFGEVLFVAKDGGEMLAGSPFVANARVLGVVDGHAKGPKIRVFKKKRRKGMRRTTGHRSELTRIRITGIEM